MSAVEPTTIGLRRPHEILQSLKTYIMCLQWNPLPSASGDHMRYYNHSKQRQFLGFSKEPSTCYTLLKNKGYLLDSLVPWSTFNIHGIFHFHKRFFRLLNVLSTKKTWFKNCSLQSLRNPTWFFHGINVKTAFIYKSWFFREPKSSWCFFAGSCSSVKNQFWFWAF